MDREAQNFDNEMKRQGEGRVRQASLGAGAMPSNMMVDTAPNRVMDKRLCQDMLFQRAAELERQSAGIRRMAELIGATSDNDYALFMAVLTMVDRR